MLQFTVLLFGPAAVATGTDRVVIESPEPCCVDELKLLMAHQFPPLKDLLDVGRLAINQGFVSGDTPVAQSDEIALITMVSGG